MFNAYRENAYFPYFEHYEDAEAVDFFIQVSYEIMTNPRRDPQDRAEELARVLVAFVDSPSYDYLTANETLYNAFVRFSNACDDVNYSEDRNIDDAAALRVAFLDAYKEIDALLYELI